MTPDTLALVRDAATVVVRLPRDVAWLLFPPLALGIYLCVQAAVHVLAALWERTPFRRWG